MNYAVFQTTPRLYCRFKTNREIGGSLEKCLRGINLKWQTGGKRKYQPYTIYLATHSLGIAAPYGFQKQGK